MSGDGSIRGDMEIKCPRCDKWEPMDYDYSVSVHYDGEIYRMSAQVTGYIKSHKCLATAEANYGW